MIEIVIFPNTTALALYVARDRGLLAREGVEIAITTTPDSIHQMSGLIEGRYHIATTAVDNAIAYQEGQGAVIPAGTPDLFVLMGVARMSLQLVVPPDVQSYADLKGRTLVVDALQTGFTFLLRRMLELGGLGPEDYRLVPVGATPKRWEALGSGAHSGALMTDSFTAVALERGFRVLDNSVDVVSPYASQAATARRSWAAANRDELVGFIRAYAAAVDWILDPANEAEAGRILAANRPGLSAGAATTAVNQLRSPTEGLLPHAALDLDGVRTVLALRSRYGEPRKTLKAPEAYIDLSWYDAALGSR